MTTDDTRPLAALLHSEFITHEMGKGSTDDACDLCLQRATHLVAAGVGFTDTLDAERARHAALVAAARGHVEAECRCNVGTHDTDCGLVVSEDALRAALDGEPR